MQKRNLLARIKTKIKGRVRSIDTESVVCTATESLGFGIDWKSEAVMNYPESTPIIHFSSK